MFLKGVAVRDLVKHPDDRGFFSEVLRSDWSILKRDVIVQVSLQKTFPSIIRAWHRHVRGQTDYWTVIDGTIRVCVYDDKLNSPTRGHMNEVILTSEKLQILRVPGYYWHGLQSLGDRSSVLIHIKNKLYDYKNPDKETRAWNDPSVVPKLINGRTNDPRVGKSWDWSYPLNR